MLYNLFDLIVLIIINKKLKLLWENYDNWVIILIYIFNPCFLKSKQLMQLKILLSELKVFSKNMIAKGLKSLSLK